MLGETVLDIQVLRTENILQIVVLGEHNLFLLNGPGLIFARKFDFNPLCMCSYLLYPLQVMILIASEYNSLLVFAQNRIKWIAQMSSKPICLLRGSINSTNGTLISLSDTGDLNCFYLGTNPSFSFINITPSFQSIDFETCEKELKSLKKVIKAFNESNSSTNSVGKSTKVHDEVTILITELETNEDKYTETTSVDLNIIISTVDCSIFDLRVTLSVSLPLKINKSVTSIPNLDVNSKYNLTATISSPKSTKFLPSSLKLVANVLYHINSPTTAPRVVQSNYFLPVRLISNSMSSFNLDLPNQMSIDIINSPQLTLNDLLPSIESKNDFETSIQLTTITGNSCVSISISSKRIQQKLLIKSNSYECLMFITLHLLQKCKNLGCKFDPASFDKNSLKLDQFFKLIDSYSSIKSKINEIEDNLEKQSSYFKSVIKRILIKLKDRNPTPLNKLDLMLERLHQKVSITI